MQETHRSTRRAPRAAGALALLIGVARAHSSEGAAPSFTRDVMPVFARHCLRCHGPVEQQAGLRLDDYRYLMRGGDDGPVVIARNPNASLLVAKIERRDRPAMPPKRPLPPASIARIRAWILAGAAAAP